MENTVKYLEPIPRRFPSALTPLAVGHVHKKKTDLVQRPFSTYNLSFVLKGEGYYQAGDQTLQVVAPTTFIQWPDAPMDYGPFENWTEFYIIYDAASIPALQAAKLDRIQNPIWKIQQTERVQQLIDQILSLLHHWDDLQIDTLDRLCELLLVTSLTPERESQSPPSTNRIDQARQWIDTHFSETLSIEAVADRFGFSPVTFRRHWIKRTGSPPGQYLTRLRLQKARHLLVETDLPVSTISRQVGYEDPLYFSRRFRQEINTTPTQYRNENQATIQTHFSAQLPKAR